MSSEPCLSPSSSNSSDLALLDRLLARHNPNTSIHPSGGSPSSIDALSTDGAEGGYNEGRNTVEHRGATNGRDDDERKHHIVLGEDLSSIHSLPSDFVFDGLGLGSGIDISSLQDEDADFIVPPHFLRESGSVAPENQRAKREERAVASQAEGQGKTPSSTDTSSAGFLSSQSLNDIFTALQNQERAINSLQESMASIHRSSLPPRRTSLGVAGAESVELLAQRVRQLEGSVEALAMDQSEPRVSGANGSGAAAKLPADKQLPPTRTMLEDGKLVTEEVLHQVIENQHLITKHELEKLVEVRLHALVETAKDQIRDEILTGLAVASSSLGSEEAGRRGSGSEGKHGVLDQGTSTPISNRLEQVKYDVLAETSQYIDAKFRDLLHATTSAFNPSATGSPLDISHIEAAYANLQDQIRTLKTDIKIVQDTCDDRIQRMSNHQSKVFDHVREIDSTLNCVGCKADDLEEAMRRKAGVDEVKAIQADVAKCLEAVKGVKATVESVQHRVDGLEDMAEEMVRRGKGKDEDSNWDGADQKSDTSHDVEQRRLSNSHAVPADSQQTLNASFPEADRRISFLESRLTDLSRSDQFTATTLRRLSDDLTKLQGDVQGLRSNDTHFQKQLDQVVSVHNELRGELSTVVVVNRTVRDQLDGMMASVVELRQSILGIHETSASFAINGGENGRSRTAVGRKEMAEPDVSEIAGDPASFGLDNNAAGLGLNALRVRSIVKEEIPKHLTSLQRKLSQKVDTAVLEELMRHIATRDELKRMVDRRIKAADGKTGGATGGESTVGEAVLKTVDKKLAALKKDILHNQRRASEGDSHGIQNMESLKNGIVRDVTDKVTGIIQRTVDDHATSIADELDVKFGGLRREIVGSIPLRGAKQSSAPGGGGLNGISKHSSEDTEEKLRRDLKGWVGKELSKALDETVTRIDQRVLELRDEVEDIVSKHVAVATAAVAPPNTQGRDYDQPGNDDDPTSLYARITRDFDEKLFLLCSDLSACKALCARQVTQPFYRCGQWVWKSGALKFGSAVPWNYETVNTDPDNFKWEQDQVNVRVAQSGLYEITFAFFTKAKPSIQLVVNGESVLSAINSPSYVVHHSSGFVVDGDGRCEPGTVTGISLLDFLALPAKSTISVHYHGGKKNMLGHGFLSLRRL
ncbi:hypothetical protein HK104_002181 [Borealophlyctis nickersoniae]|nr:hypothetical protein HK104_002181 [Borealophlyctis nickersoniae]